MGGGMMGTTDWTPVLVVLAIGLVGGLILAFRLVRGAPAKTGTAATSGETPKARKTPAHRLPAELELSLRDLAARRDALLARLSELEETAPGEVGPARVAFERWDLEMQAAKVLRELAEVEAEVGTAALPTAVPAPDAQVRWKGLAYAIGGAAFFLAAILAVRQFSTAKGGMGAAPAMDESAERAHDGDAPPNPRIDALAAELAAHPDDIEIRLDLAEQYLVDTRLFEAFETAKPVLDRQPENPRALTYVAVVKLAMGQVDEAGRMLDTAIAKDAKLPEALSYRGLIRFQTGRFADAVADWEQAIALRPTAREAIEPMIAEAKSRAAGLPPPAAMPPAPTPDAPAASRHPTAPTPASAMPPAAVPADAKFAGRIELAPALVGKIPPGATLFVIVRPDGVVSGPPAAARRIDAPTFPVSFSLGAEHSMTGAPLPDEATIEVRLDADGNAMTKDSADPIARLTGVAIGTRDLNLVLGE